MSDFQPCSHRLAEEMPRPARHAADSSATVQAPHAAGLPAQGMAHAPQAATRHLWIDTARGMIIVLVVLGHAVNGLLGAGFLPSTPFWRDLYAQLHTFRMPAFFLVCGLLVQHRLGKGLARFLYDTAVRIGWPFMLWGSAQLVAIWLASRWVNRPIDLDWYRFVSMPWAPPSQFWFLQALAGFHLLAAAFHWQRHMRGLYVLAAVLLLTKLAADQNLLPFDDITGLLSGEYPWFLVLYTTGLMLGPGLGLQPWRPLAYLVLAGLAGWLWLAMLPGAMASRPPLLGWQGAICSMAGVTACLALAHHPVMIRSNVLRYIGRHSLSVLVLHIFFIAGARIVLTNVVGVTDPLLLLALVLAAGIGAPLLLFRLAERWQVLRLAGLS